MKTGGTTALAAVLEKAWGHPDIHIIELKLHPSRGMNALRTRLGIILPRNPSRGFGLS